jgi:glycosyltransferase involved in cell wall biosynthesis
MNPPLVSVVIPCYNAAAFLRETIASVLAQSLEDVEILCVDDGSSDSTTDVIASFSDPRIRAFRQENAGVSVARNRGIAAARGDYIAFLDADDLFEPLNLDRKVAFLESEPTYGLVYAQELIFDSESGRVMGQSRGWPVPELRDLLEMRAGINSPSSVVVRTSLIRAIGGFDPSLSTSADWDAWIRLAARTRFGYIDEILSRYRTHEGQMHLNIDRMSADIRRVIAKSREAGLFDSRRHHRYCSARTNLIVAASFLKDAGNYPRFVEHLLRSVAAHPGPLLERIVRGRPPRASLPPATQ